MEIVLSVRIGCRIQRDLLHCSIGGIVGRDIQSPIRSMSHWQRVTRPPQNPRILSLNTNISTAADAPKPANNVIGDLSKKYGNYNNPADKKQQHLKNLHKAFHGTALLLVLCIIHIQHHQQQAVDGKQYCSNDIYRTYFL